MFVFDCRLVIQPQYAFGAKGNEDFKIPPNATVEYTVTLNSFEKVNIFKLIFILVLNVIIFKEVQSWTLAEPECLEKAKLYKEKGTSFLRKEDYKLAIKLYEKSNSFLSSCSKFVNCNRLQSIEKLKILFYCFV